MSDEEQLDVLWLAAELSVSMGKTLVVDLPKRIAAAAAELAARREPSLRSYASWLEIYGALVTSAAASNLAAHALQSALRSRGVSMSSKLLVVLGLAVAVAVANGGCTGSHSASNAAATAGSCSKLTPCGGAVVGQWKVSSLCLDNPGALISTPLQEPACQGTIRSYDLRASGTYQFAADGTESDDVRFTIDMDALWTSACLTAIAHGAAIDLAATCTGIEMNYSQNAQFAGASCEVAASACSCMVTSVEKRSTNSGHYTIDGTNLVEDQGSSSYCVAGNTLKIHSAGTDGAGMLTLTR